MWGEYPTLTGLTSYDGIPGGPADAWSAAVVANLETAALTPYPPEVWQFFPAETAPAPNLIAWGDFTLRMTFEPNIGDIATEIAGVQDTLNAEAAAFFSSTPDDVFTEAAKAYYTAQDAYLQENAPEYYANLWKPWYDSTIVPILG